MEFPHATNAFKKLNPHLFGLVRAVEADFAKPTALPALVQSVPIATGGAESVRLRVHLIACRRRLLDGHDNALYACKPLVDAIAERLGLDDADPRIEWHYDQIKTDGEEGVIVKMELSRSWAKGAK